MSARRTAWTRRESLARTGPTDHRCEPRDTRTILLASPFDEGAPLTWSAPLGCCRVHCAYQPTTCAGADESDRAQGPRGERTHDAGQLLGYVPQFGFRQAVEGLVELANGEGAGGGARL